MGITSFTELANLSRQEELAKAQRRLGVFTSKWTSMQEQIQALKPKIASCLGKTVGEKKWLEQKAIQLVWLENEEAYFGSRIVQEEARIAELKAAIDGDLAPSMAVDPADTVVTIPADSAPVFLGPESTSARKRSGKRRNTAKSKRSTSELDEEETELRTQRRKKKHQAT